jgi:hypothetical protein
MARAVARASEPQVAVSQETDPDHAVGASDRAEFIV